MNVSRLSPLFHLYCEPRFRLAAAVLAAALVCSGLAVHAAADSALVRSGAQLVDPATRDQEQPLSSALSILPQIRQESAVEAAERRELADKGWGRSGNTIFDLATQKVVEQRPLPGDGGLPSSKSEALINGGFEGSALSPWTTDYWTASTTFPHSGGGCAHSSGNYWIRQDFSAIPVSGITSVSYWIRQPEAQISAIDFFYSDGSWTEDIIDVISTSWEQKTVTSYLQAGKSLTGIRIYGYSSSPPDDTYLDDVSIIVSGVNILANPGFEGGATLSSWTTDYWTASTTSPHTGAGCAHSAGNYWIRQDFAAIPVSSISSVTYWIRQPEAQISAVDFFYSDSTWTEDIIDVVSTSWEQKNVTSYLTAGKSLTGIRIYGYSSSPPDDTYLDDVSIQYNLAPTATPTRTPTTPPTSTPTWTPTSSPSPTIALTPTPTFSPTVTATPTPAPIPAVNSVGAVLLAGLLALLLLHRRK